MNVNQREAYFHQPKVDGKTYTTKKKKEIARNIFLCYTVIINTIGEEK